MKLVISCVFVACALAAPVPSLAGTFYVRAGATGANNGTDWQNAYPQLPATLVRGNIYYIAGGNYGNHSFSDPASGSQVIEIRKATAADHGTSTGWQSAYQSPAYWGALSFQTSYYVFDGVTGYGRDGEPYGFQQNFTNRSSRIVALDIDGSFITIKHLKSYWDDRDDLSEVQSRWLEGTTGSPANVTVSYCYVKELPGLPFYFINSANVLVEYFVLEGMHSDANFHAEIASIRGLTNLTVRYSYFIDGTGTGGWMSMEGNNTDWKLYGNVFEQTPRGLGFGLGVFADNMQPGTVTSGVFYNNTVANHSKEWRSGLAFWASTSPIESRNNIARNSVSYGNLGVDVASNNYLSSLVIDTDEFDASRESQLQVDSLDPFVNSARDSIMNVTDWQLSGRNLPQRGYTLPAPYNQSCINRLWQGPLADCVVRGGDGYWDRGAIEYGSGLTPPSPPTNVRIIQN